MKEPAKNMNVFEDLIDELKEENLIEETVVKTSKAAEKAGRQETASLAKENPPSQEIEAEEIYEAADLMAEPLMEAEHLPAVEVISEGIFSAENSAEFAPASSGIKDNSEEMEFYRKRAMEEVAFLQMVESAFAGVERDQLKIVPTMYDDLEVKKVLHSYLQILPKAAQSERSQEEFRLMQATENWYSSLAVRDQRVMPTHLRRYCETSRPPLSMPALIALARFYRNAPFTEQVRCKFDLMLTRIFSHEDYTGRRELTFERGELIGHMKDLYAEWSSVPMYSTEENDEGIMQTVAQFEDFAKEAKEVESFDALINGNFFNRLRQFKESTNEDFYAPPVAAAAVEINAEIGNRYIELLERETMRDGVEAVESRYGSINDSTISETMSKTMSLVELLSQKQAPPEPEEEIEVEEFIEPLPEKPPVVQTEAEKAIEKNTKYAQWIFTIVGAFVLAAIVYFALGFFSTPEVISTAPPLDIQNSQLKNHLKSAQIEDGKLLGVVLPDWEKMNSDDRKAALKTMLSFGGEKGYRSVELFDDGHQKIAIADDGGVYVIE